MKIRGDFQSSSLSALSALALALTLAGCSGADTDGSSASDSSASGPAAAPAGPTYYRDVKPILDAKCTGCHTEGGIAPFSLTTFEPAKAQAAAIKAAVSLGIMPPWPPAKGCTDYEDDRSLSDDEIETIKQWAGSGAAEGDARDATPATPSEGHLSRVDRTLTLPEPFAPVLAPDDYRCFVLDLPETTTRYITGMGVEPGNRSIVHHVIAFLAPPDKVAEYQALDDADPALGYPCFGGPGGEGRLNWMGAWVPGSGQGRDFPAGTGIEVPPGSKVVVQIHYNVQTPQPAPDTTKLLLALSDTVEKKAVIMPFTDPKWVTAKTMSIPAHMMGVSYGFALDPTPVFGIITGGAFESGKPLTVYSAGLHMHTRGTRAKTTIQRQGGGEECMLGIDHWNFHWQGSYNFTKPKTLNPGDQLQLECQWDNPGATDLNWGEGTGDEMCLGTYYVTQ